MVFDETVGRHATRPQATEFTTDGMARWWVSDDVLGLPGEVVIGPVPSVVETAARLPKLVNGQAAPKDASDSEPRPGATVPGPVERIVRPVTYRSNWGG